MHKRLIYISVAFLIISTELKAQSSWVFDVLLNGSYHKNITILDPQPEYQQRGQVFIRPQISLEYRFNPSSAVGLGYWQQTLGVNIWNYPQTHNGVETHSQTLQSRDFLSFPFYYSMGWGTKSGHKLSVLIGGQAMIGVLNGTTAYVSNYIDSTANEYHYDSTTTQYPAFRTIGLYTALDWQLSKVMHLRLTLSSAFRPLMTLQAYYSHQPHEYRQANIYTDFGTRLNFGLGFNLSNLFRRSKE